MGFFGGGGGGANPTFNFLDYKPGDLFTSINAMVGIGNFFIVGGEDTFGEGGYVRQDQTTGETFFDIVSAGNPIKNFAIGAEDRLFAACGAGGLYYTDNYGVTWVQVVTDQIDYVACDPSSGIVIIAEHSVELGQRSTNNGDTFSGITIGGTPIDNVKGFKFLPELGLFVSADFTPSNGFFYSSDGSNGSWSVYNFTFDLGGQLAAIEEHDSLIYVVSNEFGQVGFVNSSFSAEIDLSQNVYYGSYMADFATYKGGEFLSLNGDLYLTQHDGALSVQRQGSDFFEPLPTITQTNLTGYKSIIAFNERIYMNSDTAISVSLVPG